MEGEDWVKLIADNKRRAHALEYTLAELEDAGYEISDAKGATELLLARAFRHARDDHIKFVEDTHTYYVHGRRMPMSVSGFWRQYFEDDFDADAILTKYLDGWRDNRDNRYYGLLQYFEVVMGLPAEAHAEEIKRMWSMNGEHKSALGTDLHRQIELYFNKAPHDSSSTEFKQFMQWYEDHGHLVAVRTEMNLWAEDLQLAGQLDALFWDACSSKFVLVDWKRVQKLEMTPGRFTKYGRAPFQSLPNTNWGHYVVQQNVYAEMCRKYYGIPVEEMYLLQLHGGLGSYDFIKVPDLRDDVTAAFKERVASVEESRAAAAAEAELCMQAQVEANEEVDRQIQEEKKKADAGGAV